MTLTTCLFLAGNTLTVNVFYPHIIQVWRLASFIVVRVFHNLLVDKREQVSHFLFVYNHNTNVKKEFAENP